MKTLFSFLLMVAFCTVLSAQSVFIVQGTSTTTAHASLSEAINAATDGDYVYLPGGTFTIGSVKISKRLNIIGAGHYPDSTQATGRTLLTGTIYFKTGASNSTIQGIYLTDNIYLGDAETTGVVSNILISRCNIKSMYMSYSWAQANKGASNIIVRECIIRGDVCGSNTQGALIENSIISGQVTYFDGNAEFNNNLFLYSTNGYMPLNYVSSSNFKNNIFKTAYGVCAGGSNNNYNNCVFVTTNTSNNGINTNCKYAVTYTDLFVNVPNVSTFEYTYNYQLSAISAAKGAGIGGTDCGIYGGANPYKEGAVPSNPHIQFKSIPTATDNQGKLNIQIKVAAQEK